MCPGARQSEVSYWLNQVESSSSLEGSGLTPARMVTKEASFKTRVRPGPNRQNTNSITSAHRINY